MLSFLHHYSQLVAEVILQMKIDCANLSTDLMVIVTVVVADDVFALV